MKRHQTLCLAVGLLCLAAGCPRSPKHPGQQLCSAAEAGDLGQVRLLLKRGLDVNAGNVHGSTALHEVALNDRRELARFLIEKGANINASDAFGRTPLYNAVEENHLDMIRLLISMGADVNAKVGDAETVLHEAVGYRDTETVTESSISKVPMGRDDLGVYGIAV
jgi:ankyrin repeat protein